MGSPTLSDKNSFAYTGDATNMRTVCAEYWTMLTWRYNASKGRAAGETLAGKNSTNIAACDDKEGQDSWRQHVEQKLALLSGSLHLLNAWLA